MHILRFFFFFWFGRSVRLWLPVRFLFLVFFSFLQWHILAQWFLHPHAEQVLPRARQFPFLWLSPHLPQLFVSSSLCFIAYLVVEFPL